MERRVAQPTQDTADTVDISAQQHITDDVNTGETPNVKEQGLTANPGDRIAEKSQTMEEKAQQLAVDSPDITGEHLEVPAYFVVDYPDGEQKALHHVKDAEEISDVIRLARVDEEGNQVWR
jgi:hypothetical protein